MMGLGSHKRRRAIAMTAALVLIAAWQLPSFFSAEHYRRRLEISLERALHHPVSFGLISLRLLPRPGFSIQNALVREAPGFGSEPLARVDRIECDLRWRSLWRSRLDLARLRLDRARLNFVRNPSGEWNFENLIRQSGIASLAVGPTVGGARVPGDLTVEADDARISFMVGPNKKPFAITEMRARLQLQPGKRLLTYRISGKPVRTDLPLPSPGAVELEGEWSPGDDLGGPLNAVLRTSGALLYNWAPLVTGYNPGIYGVLDAQLHVSGSLRAIRIDGESRLAQLHRWEQIPPSDPTSIALHFRGEFDRRAGRASLESADASFGESRVHVTGFLDNFSGPPNLDLAFALERSRLEDLVAVSRCFGASLGAFGVSGRVDGLLSVRGSWAERRYGGFLNAQDVRLRTAAGTFPLSEVAVRVDKSGARLAPTRIALAPRVELIAEGGLERQPPRKHAGSAEPSRYDLMLSAKAIPLRDLLRFARALGFRAAQNLDAQGAATATFHLNGSAWPLTRPTLLGRAEIRTAELLVPGLTEPLKVPAAHLEVNGSHVVVDPVAATIGATAFSGRLEYQGDRQQPCRFDVAANTLSIEQAARWFDVLGLRGPVPLLERLPGLRSLAGRRVAASNLFASLSAAGRFQATAVTYRSLTLSDFRASVEISGRAIHIANATFRSGGGRGLAQAQVDLARVPARVVADVNLTNASLQKLAPLLPLALRGLRGSYSSAGHFETRGLSREEISSNLQGQATLRLRNIDLGDFDPLAAVARNSGWGSLEPARGEAGIRTAAASLRIADRRIYLASTRVELGGATLSLAGTYTFPGVMDLDVTADLRRVRRRWGDPEGQSAPAARLGSLHLAGPIDRLAIAPETRVSRAIP